MPTGAEGPTLPTKERELEVSQQMDNLGHEIEMCGQAMATLGSRLRPVKSSVLKDADEAELPSLAELAPMADTLRTYCEKVRAIRQDIEEQIQRLEI